MANEHDAVLRHVIEGLIEIVDAQEEPDATCELVTNRSRLSVTIGFRKEQTGAAIVPVAATGRADDDPSLWATVVGQRRPIFYELESESLDKESYGFVVVVNDQRDKIKFHGIWHKVKSELL